MSFFMDLFSKKYKNINGDEFDNIVKNNKYILVLDVRTSDEFKSGHIPKSKNIPVNELRSRVSTLSLYKDEEVIIYCASGMRSSSASNILSKNGFNKIYNLSGGIGSYKHKLK